MNSAKQEYAFVPMDSRTMQMRTGMVDVTAIIIQKKIVVAVVGTSKSKDPVPVVEPSRVLYFQESLKMLSGMGVKTLCHATGKKSESFCAEILERLNKSNHETALNG